MNKVKVFVNKRGNTSTLIDRDLPREKIVARLKKRWKPEAQAFILAQLDTMDAADELDAKQERFGERVKRFRQLSDRGQAEAIYSLLVKQDIGL